MSLADQVRDLWDRFMGERETVAQLTARFEAVTSDPDSDIFEAYHAFCEREFATENIDFVRKYAILKPKLGKLAQQLQLEKVDADYSDLEAAVRASLDELYSTYLAANAPQLINLPGEGFQAVRTAIPPLLEEIAGPGPAPAAITAAQAALDVTCDEIKNLLKMDTFQRFKRTRDYRDWLRAQR